jgi:enoyl-CoA hydratase/carnithine racemase
MNYDNLLYEVAGPLALITLNRPKKLNAISLATVDELHAAIARATDDPAVRVIGITGAGDKAFAAGSDLAEVVHRDLNKALEPIVQGIAERLERCPKPTIAAINGICYGGGLEVALGCDLRVAARSARFATPEGKLGIIPGGGATQRLPRLVGRTWALDMLLTGEPIDADRALHIGLVTRLVDDAELLPSVRALAQHLASFAPLVPRYMKAMVHAGMEGSLAAGLALEKFAQAGLCETADKKEGLAAFLDKRPPNWTGR